MQRDRASRARIEWAGELVATILILDNNLGFAFWLGQALSTANCEALPAMNVPEANAMIGHFKLDIDLVILNPSVPGAADFTRNLRQRQGHLRVATLDSEAFDEANWSLKAWPMLSREQ